MSEIRKLKDLLKPHLNCDTTILGCNIKRLTKPGEHYGSVMLAVEVKLRTQNGQEETLNIVGKKIPDNEWLQMMFNVQYTFVKEMKFYDTVIPTLKEFQLQQGMGDIVDFFPHYFGGRINLNPGSDKVDDDAVMLLENLKLSGYETMDRLEGFDFEKAEYVIKDLAVFHAIPMALRILKPNVFEEKIKPHIPLVHMFDIGNKELEAGLMQRFEKIASESEECVPFLDRVRAGVSRGFESWGKPYDGLFGSVIHNDFWTSNTMQKYEDNKIVSNKILDFQIVTYDSIAKDVVFFLFSSIQMDVLKKNYDKLVQAYFDKLIETLKRLKCDVTPFTFDAFQKELDRVAVNSEFYHSMVMLKPILTSLHDVKDMKDMTPDDVTTDNVPQRQMEKGWFIIKEFAKRNWI